MDHFKALSVGKWVRAQGRIEEDTFVRDLVMMMSDIEEIKRHLNKIKQKISVEFHLHTSMSQMDGILILVHMLNKLLNGAPSFSSNRSQRSTSFS